MSWSVLVSQANIAEVLTAASSTLFNGNAINVTLGAVAAALAVYFMQRKGS